MIFEGRIAGIDFFDIENWTWGEVVEFINVKNERDNRQFKEQSKIAYIQAGLIVSYISGNNTEMTVSEVFPYWTDEEQQEMKKQALIQKYKDRMYRHVNNSRKGD